MQTEKVLIRLVDDDEDQRKALRFFLESMGYEVRDYPGAEAFLKYDEPEVPGCLILDLQMPGMDGLSLLSHLREHKYKVPVIFLSAHGDIPTVVKAMKKGSLDFIEKPVNGFDLCSLLTKILERDRGIRQGGITPQKARELLAKLSPRQLKVAELLAQGLLKREVAERLNIGVKTVDSHALVIYSALDVHSVAELAALMAASKLEDVP